MLLALAALAANGGLRAAPSAQAATTDSVATTATVGSVLDIADQCSGTMDITVVLGGHAADDCQINFGGSNDASVTLRATSSAGNPQKGSRPD